MPVTANTGSTKVASESDYTKIATINELLDEFDAVIAGYKEKSVAGSSDVTLTRIEALNRSFKFTGALTGNISIKFPHTGGSARNFSVWNATSGAFSLTVKTTAGGSTGVAVTQGKVRECSHDGTNVFATAAETP